MKDLKIKKLRESFEEGVISKEEFEKKKKEIEDAPEETKKDEEKEEEEPRFKSDKVLIIAIVIVVLLFAAVFGVKFLTKEMPQTIEELHLYNIKGKLDPEQGYMYEGVYSFVKFDDLWYMQLKSPQGTRLYNIQFRYGPMEVENIKIEGTLDSELFNDAKEYYVTFDPNGNDFSHVALAVADFNQHMTNIFFKQPIAACDKNNTKTCKDRPIITCENTQDVVLYVKEANATRTYFDDNCIVVEGSGLDLVKNVDRVLYYFYDMMGQ